MMCTGCEPLLGQIESQCSQSQSQKEEETEGTPKPGCWHQTTNESKVLQADLTQSDEAQRLLQVEEERRRWSPSNQNLRYSAP
jgi:uncharacterized membrane protein YgaE (UPF0421/DUF939 family)